MTVFRLLLLTLLLAVTVGKAAAQRCLPGMKGVQLSADMVDGFYSPAGNDGMGYAFSLAFFNYVKNGNKWEYGVEYVRRNCRYRTVGVPMEQYTADAGYFLNLLGRDWLRGGERRQEYALRRGGALQVQRLHIRMRRHVGGRGVRYGQHRSCGKAAWACPVGRCFGSVPLPLRRFIEVCFLTANKYLHEKKSEVFIYLLLRNFSVVIHNVMRRRP